MNFILFLNKIIYYFIYSYNNYYLFTDMENIEDQISFLVLNLFVLVICGFYGIIFFLSYYAFFK